MNKKHHALVAALVRAVDLQIDYPNDANKWTVVKARAAVEKILDPPVRFAWIRHSLPRSGSTYLTSTNDARYRVQRTYPTCHPRYWTATANGVEIATMVPLTAAKQACVDFDVAQHRAKTKAAQIHTDPAIRAALTPTQKG